MDVLQSLSMTGSNLEELQDDLLAGAASEQLAESVEDHLPCSIAHAHSCVPIHIMFATRCALHTAIAVMITEK